MKRKFHGFTLIELLVVIAIIALLISILLPSLSRARELSKRLVCGSNSKGIGTSAKIYANDNAERWMIPGFNDAKVNNGGIDYLYDGVLPAQDAGMVGWEREFQSLSNTAVLTNVGSTALSTTRSYWMLVRSGDITVKQFTCPSGNDEDDQTENLELYYDFTLYGNISYGYQVPFGPRDTQPREGVDNRLVLTADKGPFYSPPESPPSWQNAQGTEITLDDSPKSWRRYNSANHGGKDNGEGQNCLFADGHADFKRLPAVGIDNDNIYTVMNDQWTNEDFNRIHGDEPHVAATGGPPYPGQFALGTGAGDYASTDTLIYP